MTPERFQQIRKLFEEALEQAPDRRTVFLEQACGEDNELRSEVQRMLIADAQLVSPIDVPAAAAWPKLAPDPSNLEGRPPGAAESLGPAGTSGMVIDRYHLLQKIGEGGMGEVWLAEQKEPVRRRVALKLVKAGMDTREVIARFESERQALALMDHPAIAKVFDAGSTPQGAPYFVMEYVAGVPITTYCDDHRLSTRDRLELFIHVCEGVEHAHQKAIIHRDLKPSNILVTELDGRAAPKIIDFGVAKALTKRLNADTMFTRVGALLGTPEYMSPEQALSSGEDIDTRTDVYSLGIILYELLAGVPPLELRKIALEEFLRRLREEEPPKPSTQIGTQDPATSTEVARKRQTEPLALTKQIRGDLDSIALKALEKDRSRRYGSPSDLAADIGRYLKNETVLAVPPSAAYRARKFARRHRAVLVTASTFVLVLILAAGISIWQGLRATRERDRANKEAAVAQAVNDFLRNDLLAQASPSKQGDRFKPDPDLTVRTVLDRAAGGLTGKFDRQPEVEAAIRDTIGQAYVDLGRYAQAQIQLERVLELDRRVFGAMNPKTVGTISRLGLIDYLQGEYPEAEALYGQALAAQRRVLGSEHRDTLVSMSKLASVYYWQHKYAQAEALYVEMLQIQRRVLGPEHGDTLDTMSSLTRVYESQAKYAQAEALISETLKIHRRVLGPEHPGTLNDMSYLAVVYESQGKYAQADALLNQTLEIRRRVQGTDHADTLNDMNTLAVFYESQGKHAQAEALLDEKRKITLEESARFYIFHGKFAESEPLARKVLEFNRKERPDDWQRFFAESLLGASLAGQKKYAEAETLLLEGYHGMLAHKDRIAARDRWHVDHAIGWLVQLYLAWGKPAKAAEWTKIPPMPMPMSSPAAYPYRPNWGAATATQNQSVQNTHAMVIFTTVASALSGCLAVLVAYYLGRWFGWRFRYRRAGELVLDASRILPFRKSLYIFGVLLVCLILAALICSIAFGWSSSLWFQVAFLAYLTTRQLTDGKVEFRQRGIVHAGWLVPWDHIESWGWGTRSEDLVVLRIKRRLPFLPPARLHVPASKEVAIERVMQQHLCVSHAP
jgi:non-specific serine/threonine protein kinase/serine/threonine-protein kinase